MVFGKQTECVASRVDDARAVEYWYPVGLARWSHSVIKTPHSSAIVKGIAENTITWEADPDFGYQVASAVPGIPAEDIGILQPRVLYAEQGRGDEYGDHVSRIQKERVEYMNSFLGLDEEIISALTS